MTIYVKMRGYLLIVCCLLTGFFFTACNEIPNCSGTSENLLKVKFTSVDFDTENDVFVLTDSLVIIQEVRSEERPDSLIIEQADTTSLLTLPVSPYSNTSGYLITINDSEYVLRVTYDREARLIAPECGIEQVYKNLDISGTLPGDSVLILNDRLLRPSDENQNINVEIFF
ncbi:hypothetical protein AB9P05_10685 [Roseivirga sp. BDSF3-8]|uniref:hypothetical protein n=1 Tax=Roseivirga sp. BDSF3-8 TaxID=3241598 RepID=UPI003531C820